MRFETDLQGEEEEDADEGGLPSFRGTRRGAEEKDAPTIHPIIRKVSTTCLGHTRETTGEEEACLSERGMKGVDGRSIETGKEGEETKTGVQHISRTKTKVSLAKMCRGRVFSLLHLRKEKKTEEPFSTCLLSQGYPQPDFPSGNSLPERRRGHGDVPERGRHHQERKDVEDHTRKEAEE